jgi:hypothetical protein
MKRIALASFLLSAPTIAIACGNDVAVTFGDYSSQTSPYVTFAGDKVTIDMSFLDEIIRRPSGLLLDENRPELLYLMASNDRRAAHAGAVLLAHLIQNPTFVVECDTRRELFGKEELALALSRSVHAPAAICAIPHQCRSMIVDFYRAHQSLWTNIDPPWVPGDLPCD